MPLFGRKKRDDVLNDWEGANPTAGIDFSSYDLDGLRDDVVSIVDLPDAMKKTAKWAFGIPIAVGILSWVIFSSRMAGWVLVPFVLGAVVLSVVGSVFIGGFFVARKRLDTVSQATNRVVTVVGEMHADVLQVKEGASQTSIKEVATGLLEHAIFPIVFGMAEGFAANASGPFSKISGRATDYSMGLVQKSVIGAVNKLPDHEIGSVVEDASALMPQLTEALSELNGTYQRVAGDIENIVGRVSKATLGSVIGAAAVAMIPLLLWLVIGWVAS